MSSEAPITGLHWYPRRSNRTQNLAYSVVEPPIGAQDTRHMSEDWRSWRQAFNNELSLYIELLPRFQIGVRRGARARIHSQFESLGFVGKYDQSPTNIVNSWTLKYEGADFLQNPRIFSLQNGPRMRAKMPLNENLPMQWNKTFEYS
jgi:hypothetical protein